MIFYCIFERGITSVNISIINWNIYIQCSYGVISLLACSVKITDNYKLSFHCGHLFAKLYGYPLSLWSVAIWCLLYFVIINIRMSTFHAKIKSSRFTAHMNLNDLYTMN